MKCQNSNYLCHNTTQTLKYNSHCLDTPEISVGSYLHFYFQIF